MRRSLSCLAISIFMLLWLWPHKDNIPHSKFELFVSNNHQLNNSHIMELKEDAKRRLAYQQRIKEEGDLNLENLTEIKRQNSHVS